MRWILAARIRKAGRSRRGATRASRRLVGHQRIGQTDGLADFGDRDIVAVERLNLVGAGRGEIDLRLKHIELGRRARTIAGIGEPETFLGLRHYFL